MGARRCRESIPLRIRYVIFVTILALQCGGDTALATVWDYGCENAIRALKNEQQEVESAHSDFELAESEMESAKSRHNRCTPSRYEDCESQRRAVNNAIHEYNDALDTLKSQFRDFEYAVGKFNRECLS